MIGTIITSARISARLSQNDLAVRSGLSSSLISKLERNRCAPNIETIRAISKGLPSDSRALFAAQIYAIVAMDQGLSVVGSRSDGKEEGP